MLNFRVQEQSVIASLEGTRKINGKISDLIKKEIIDFIERSGKQVVLDLNGVNLTDSKGLSMLKAIAELARVNERLFSVVNCSEDVLDVVDLDQIRDSFSIGKN